MLTIPGLGSRSDSIYYISWKRHSSCLFCLKPSQHRRGTCHHVFYGLNGTRRQLLTRKGKAVGFLFGLKYIFLTFYKNRRSRSLDGTSTLPLNYQGNNILLLESVTHTATLITTLCSTTGKVRDISGCLTSINW